MFSLNTRPKIAMLLAVPVIRCSHEAGKKGLVIAKECMARIAGPATLSIDILIHLNETWL
jgi:hypothetical protein